MSSRRDRLMQWVNETLHDYKPYISRDIALQLSDARNMSESALKENAMKLYDDIKSKGKKTNNAAKAEDPNEILYLVPHKGSDGSVTLYDRYKGHAVAHVKPTECGLPMYLGLRKYLTIMGGRGEYDTFVTRLADKDYVHDRNPRK